jgi:thioesterase domain-containing protein/acyl carrier protein
VKKGVDVEIINEYGPTEATVGCSTYSLHTSGYNEKVQRGISIGKPIDNIQLYILDSSNGLVPVGVVGEICIGGAGLARGYRNRPELTAEKFIPNPFTKESGARLYKTGDLARWLPDGNIEYLGRIDHQVKIRGYRIELGEIESALNHHPEIQHAIVVAREDSPGDKRLVAYIISDKPLPVADIRQFLSRKLPEYMVPSSFVFLRAFPITINGKVDRLALPLPDQHRPEMEKTLVAPRNALEIKLKKIWEDCLNIRPIGVQDNFFELGGHSIQAAQMFSFIRKNLGKQLPLATLFQAPTIEQLAEILGGKGVIAPWSSLVPIQPNGSRSPLFCIHAGAGTVLFYSSLSSHLGQDQPVYGLQAKGLNGNEAPQTRIEDMAAHYISEIRSIQPQGPYYLAGYCLGGILAFEMAQQLTREGQEVALLASLNGVSPTYDDSSDYLEQSDLEEIKTLSAKINDYWKNFRGLSKKEKAVYPFYLVLKKMLSYNQQYAIRRFFYRAYISRNRPLPEKLGKYYFLETNVDMVKAYRPQPYAGKMIIIRSPAVYQDPQLGWAALVTGGIETRDIPGKHANRREILNEPFVQLTVQELARYLSK